MWLTLRPSMFCKEGKFKYVPVMFYIFGFSFYNKSKKKKPNFWSQNCFISLVGLKNKWYFLFFFLPNEIILLFKSFSLVLGRVTRESHTNNFNYFGVNLTQGCLSLCVVWAFNKMIYILHFFSSRLTSSYSISSHSQIRRDLLPC